MLTYQNTRKHTFILNAGLGIALLLIPTTTPQANAQTTGLVAAYNFDEGSGSSVTDRSGTGNTGSITNATWNTAGKNKGSITFNGTNSFIKVNDANSLDLTSGMTLEAWIYPVSTTTTSSVIMKERSGNISYAMLANTPNFRPAGFITIGTTNYGAYGNRLISRNTWTHLATTFDGKNIRLYINGVLTTTQPQTGNITASNGALFIGGNALVANTSLRGRIDDVRIYNRALSAAEILSDMSTPVTGTTPPPEPTPVNGACGSSNGQSFASVPTANLCSTGTSSSVVTNASTFTWSCAGANGGTTAQCSAVKLPAAATALTMTGPTSGSVNVASTNFTVSANGALSTNVVITPSSNGGGGTFTPSTVTLSSSVSTVTFTYTPASSGAKTISITNNGGLTNPASINFSVAVPPVNGVCGSSNGQSFASVPTANLCSTGTSSSVVTNASTFTWSCAGANGGTTAQCSAVKLPAAATALTMTGPTSGSVNLASTNFTVSANGALSTNVVISPSSNGGGGTFTPSTITLSSSVATATFTYTPASSGAKTISIMNNGGLTNPNSIAFSVAAPAVNGACGSSNGQSFTSVPTSNLCSTGTASSVTTNTSTFSWNCAGSNGGTTAQCSATRIITPPPVPTVTLSANPMSVATGGTSTISWSSTNSTSCTASGSWTGTKSTSGSESVIPKSTATYSMTCTGAGGTSPSQSVTVTVTVENPKPVPPATSDIPQFLTHDGDMAGDVFNSSAPSKYYWNNVLQFPWKRGVYGDWMDATQKQFGESTSGAVPYASFALPRPGVYSANVTSLVSRWMTNGQNRGFYVRMKNNAWPVRFAGRTDSNAANRPTLTIVTSNGTFNIVARANASWDISTYAILSSSNTWTLSGNSVAILHFDLSSVTGTVQSATLKVTDLAHDGGTSGTNGTVEIYEADPPMFVVPHGSNVQSPELGFAYNLTSFKDIASQPGVIFSDDFATPGPFDSGWSRTPERTLNAQTNTTYARGSFVGGANDSASHKILAMRGAGGEGGQGMSAQHDDLYSQYHLYLENDYGSNIDGIKIPAMGTQFGYWRTYNGGYWQMTTGNGGAAGTGLKIYNSSQSRWEYEGHSVRIVTTPKPADNSAYANLYGLKLYPYNLDQVGAFPDMVNFPYVAISKERWYAIDLYMKLNSMSGTRDANGNYATANPDGVYKVWVNGYPALNKTNFRWRKHPEFGVEGFWLDFYHGGVPPAPYTMHYRVDRVTIAKNYIGPQKSEMISGGSGTPTSPTSSSGVCGSSDGLSLSTVPISDLCSSGNASAVTANATTYTWSCSGSSGGATATCSATRILSATALTLSGPTSGNINVSSTSFMVEANGTINGTVIVTPSSNGGGSFNPTTVSLTNTSPAAAFTFTPNSTGTKSISITNNGGLTNPAPLSFTANNLTLPSWVPAPGEVAVLTQANGKITNQFESQAAPYFDPYFYVNTVNDYSGAFKNPYWGPFGATVFWGGGHAGTNDNTVTVAEYGQTAITFKRVSDPTPWTGSTSSDAGNRGNNSSGNFNSILNYTYMEGPDGQPGSPHSYSSGDIIGPEHGGAQYGTLVQIASSAVNRNNDAGATAAHKIDFDTLTLQNASGQNRKWTRVTNNTGNFLGASPHYTVFVPAQNRIYYFASGSNDNVRWFDRNTNTYVQGTGSGFFIGESDGYDSGIVFHVPSRNLLVAMYPMGGMLKVKWMDVSGNQPTVGGVATLSQALAVSDPWSAATWVPDSNRIVLAGVTGDNTAAYEIEIPSSLSNPWTVTRAPFGAGQTFAPFDKQTNGQIGITYKKFQYDPKVRSIVYMPRAERDGANETIWVYRPRGTQ